jgi:hypothetical protein
MERALFYPPDNRQSRTHTDEKTDALPSASVRQTAKPPGLVSLTGDGYSVVNDLSGGRDRLEMYWRTMIIRFNDTLSRRIRSSNLKNSHFPKVFYMILRDEQPYPYF